MRLSEIFAVSILFLILFSCNVRAVNVVMVVKNSTSLSYEHEQRIKDILTYMGNNVTLVDKNTQVNYTNYALIVVAGRPSTEPSYNQLDSFVANIPVNSVPTIAIDSIYIGSWGWANGVSTIFSNQPQQVYISNSTHPITSNYSGYVQVQMAPDKVTLGLSKTGTNFKFLASNNEYGMLGIIAVREPGTILSNGNVTKTAAVFFGVPSSLYWTQQTENMFKNTVNWIYDTDKDGVYDVNDLCPNTPANSTVNPSGCTCAQLGCDDRNPCTTDTCSDTQGCIYTPKADGESCDDGLFCTVNDTCSAGVCSGVPRTCDNSSLGNNYVFNSTLNAFQATLNICNESLQMCQNTTFNTNVFGKVGNYILQVNGTTALNTMFTGINRIRFLDGSSIMLECDFDFTNRTLDLTNVSIEKNTLGIGSLVVNGLNCSGPKTFYVDKIANVNYLCIKDAEILSASEISSDCNGANETLIQCNGTYTNGSYACSFISQMNKYNVTGLMHSGVKEQPTCNDGIQNGGENEVDCGGSCPACPASSSSSGGGGGGGGGSAPQPIGYVTIKRSAQVSGLLNTLVLDKNENYTFTVTVSNTGNINLYYVKIDVAGIPSSWVSVNPKLQNIPLNDEGEKFGITITPSETGIYSASLVVGTNEFDATQNLTEDPFTIKVFDSSLVPNISMDVSPLTLGPGINNTVSVKINNIGTAQATGDLSLSIPEGWIISPASQAISVDAQTAKIFNFVVMPPANATGKYPISAAVNYLSLDERKTISKSFEVEVKNNVNLAITGFFIGTFKNMNNFITFISGYVRDNFIIFISTGVALVMVLVGYFSSGFGGKGRKSWGSQTKSKATRNSATRNSNSPGFFRKLSGLKISKSGKMPWGSTVSGINKWGSRVRYIPEVKSMLRHSPIVPLDHKFNDRRRGR
jgi:hypothetical protein